VAYPGVFLILVAGLRFGFNPANLTASRVLLFDEKDIVLSELRFRNEVNMSQPAKAVFYPLLQLLSDDDGRNSKALDMLHNISGQHLFFAYPNP